jgi:hypothetical protein
VHSPPVGARLARAQWGRAGARSRWSKGSSASAAMRHPDRVIAETGGRSRRLPGLKRTGSEGACFERNQAQRAYAGATVSPDSKLRVRSCGRRRPNNVACARRPESLSSTQICRREFAPRSLQADLQSGSRLRNLNCIRSDARQHQSGHGHSEDPAGQDLR